MTRLQLLLAVFITVAITIAGGAIHGRLSWRWGGSEEAMEAAQAIESLPDQFGVWRLEQSQPLDASALDQLQPFGYVNRTYAHVDSGQRVSFFVLVGPVGQTAVHNPEVCYSSRNYTITQPKEPTTLQMATLRPDEFWTMTFRANSLEGELLRVYYGWSDGTRWEASEGGRFEFAGLPFLYKIQLASYLPGSADLEKDDACRQFLADLLPVLRTHMRSAKE